MLSHILQRRRLLRCVLILLLALCLKLLLPLPGHTVGGWIAGTRENRVSAAIESFAASFAAGAGLRDAVEVCYESWQSFTTG